MVSEPMYVTRGLDSFLRVEGKALLAVQDVQNRHSALVGRVGALVIKRIEPDALLAIPIGTLRWPSSRRIQILVSMAVCAYSNMGVSLLADA